jgi:hypothetical protein
MKKIITLTIACTVFCISNLSSKTVNPELRRALVTNEFKRVLAEKIHLSPQALELAKQGKLPISGADPKGEGGEPLSAKESVVSQVTDPESELHAAINPTDSSNIVVSAMRQNSSSGLTFPIFYTKDFGKTWKKASFVDQPDASSLRLGGGDPMFTFSADGKTIYYLWIDLAARNLSFDTVYNTIYYATSTNGGQNWTVNKNNFIVSKELINPLTATPSGSTPDKEWMATDRSGSPFGGTIYVSYVVFDATGGAEEIQVVRKGPGSSSFSAPIDIDMSGIALAQIASLAVADNGDVHITFHGTEDSLAYNIYHAVSTDGGVTFSKPAIISRAEIAGYSVASRNYGIPGMESRQVPSVQVACGRGEGHSNEVYCTWDALGIQGDEGNGSDIYFSRSEDKGKTWSTPVVVNTDERGFVYEQYRASMYVNDRGVLTICWYDGRAQEGNTTVDYYLAYSFDGGKTFVNEQIVTAAPTDFTTVGLLNSNFGVGEYVQVVASDFVAMPIWTDGRKNTGDLNIISAQVPISPTPLSGVHSRVSITGGLSITSIYPNPATDKITLTFESEKTAGVSVQLFNIAGSGMLDLGEEMYSGGENSVTLDLSGIANGSYLLRIRSAEGFAEEMVNIVK